jgi:hypothetical protein
MAAARRDAEIAKAEAIAAGWQQGPQLRQITMTTDLSGLAAQLVREPFTPGVPTSPAHPEKTDPRRWDFDPGYNLATRPRNWEPIGFEQLRGLAEGSDIASVCIERNIDDFRELDWEIRPRVVKGMTRVQVKERAKRLEDMISEITGFWQTPDQEHSWGSWIHGYLYELYTTDSACLYLRKTASGDKLYGVEWVSGDTIAPIIDEHGRLPEPPKPAYRQVIRGITWTMYARDLALPAHQRQYNFDRSILRYEPFWARAKGPYGHPPIEGVLLTINRILNRQALDFRLFADGTIPHGFWKTPAEWSATDIGQLRDAWGKIQASAQARAQLQFMPGGPGTGYEAGFKDPTTEGEEFLLHVIYAMFKRSPMKDGFVKSGGGSIGGNAGKLAEQQGSAANVALRSLGRHVLGQINRINAEHWSPEIVMVLPAFDDPQGDALARAQERQVYVTTGILSRDEVRDEMDRDPIVGEIGAPTNTISTKDGALLIAPIMTGDEVVPTDAAPATPSAAPGENSSRPAAGVAPTVAKALGGKHLEYTGDLATVVHRYLLRSYPPKDVEWALDPAIGWEYDPGVPLGQINMARRPGGRNEAKVAEIASVVGDGASMDPIVLADFGEPQLRIADGFHRTLGVERASRDAVPAFIGRHVPEPYRETVMGPMQDDSASVAKADLVRWERKACNSLRRGRSAAVRFDSTLPDDLCAHVWTGLTSARTPAEVRTVFREAAPAEDQTP